MNLQTEKAENSSSYLFRGKIIGLSGGLYKIMLCDDAHGTVYCRAKGAFRHNGLSPLVGDNVILRSEKTEAELISTDKAGNSLIKVIPHTGRTHQIRVHMAYVGHPLVNDFLYGTRGDETYSLHCASLSFPHPFTNEMITVTAEIPKN